MKIAFFINEKQMPRSEKACPGNWNCLPKVDYFPIKDGIFPTVECSVYDVIVIFPKGKTGLFQEKYSVFFNGQSYILDIRDILYLESYYRKTSVVAGSGRIRIRARLDEEEEKLPKDRFVRISRHNIINMQYVRNVKGEAVEMQNGEVLYVNGGRRKKFEKIYRDFLKNNCILL
ncbi:LytTR family DNA-binding domain-containing protein [Lacrimispora sp. BS-2]|uniref:LytTR family DNA-binding domain-containing protein n=1 Tax=Lacrimispora sp. BS-2 TaxID=3151850 RepID=A0AAU7PQE7_9FIRM